MRMLSTGVDGVDELTGGGLPGGHVYLIRGEPGTGKTTMALQFLTAGTKIGESALFLTLSQTGKDLGEIAASFGMSMDGILVEDAISLLHPNGRQRQSVVNTSEMEVDQLIGRLSDLLNDKRPDRVVLDSLIDLRLRADDVLAYRQLFRELMDLLIQAETTAVFLDSSPEFGGDSQIAGLVHGVLTLERALPGYGIAQRRLEINKMRGVRHAEGLHDFTFTEKGVRVFPRLSSRQDADPPSLETVGTGHPGLDEMTGGGISQGTAVMIYGQSGVGKSTLSGCMVKAAVDRSEQAVAFLFEEHPTTFLQRSDGLGLDLSTAVKTGSFRCHDMRAGEVLPGQFVHMALDAADNDAVKVVVIDSVNGYLTASAHKDHALAQLNTLVATLRSRQVVVVLVVEQPGFLAQIADSLDVSILSDCMILLRQYEASSQIRRSVAVIKKRTGPHLTELRQLILEPGRIDIEPIPEDQMDTMRGLHLMNARAPV